MLSNISCTFSFFGITENGFGDGRFGIGVISETYAALGIMRGMGPLAGGTEGRSPGGFQISY